MFALLYVLIEVQKQIFFFGKNKLKYLKKMSTYNVLMTNEMTILVINFYSTVILSAVHVSDESSRSSPAARHNILYCTVQSVQSCRRV